MATMKPNATQGEWDVLIVAPIGEAADFAHLLRANLAARGLAVKLDVISEQRLLPLPEACADDARRARFCVVLGTVGKVVQYALLPAPRFPGQVPKFAPVGSNAGPGQVEMGDLTEDVAAFAARVEARLRG
jgi:hypothetical protein